MMRFMPNLKMDKASETPAGGSPPANPPVTPAEPPAATPPTPPKAEGSESNDFGYEPVTPAADPSKKEGAAAKAGDTPPETPATKIAEVKDPGTGYGAEAPVVDETPVVPVVPATPPVQDEFDKVLADIPKEDAKVIKDFATENKLTPEVAAKWALKVKENVEARKVATANMERQAEQQKTIQRKKWDAELRVDPDFGGAKYETNVVRAERVLAEFMPQTKKFLTERKSMLPPYVMRDLAKMADSLYATDKLNQGEPPVTEAQEKPQTMDERINDFYS